MLFRSQGRPKTLEFNCRMGDPETQPIMMRLKSDLLGIFEHAVAGTLDGIEAEWDRRTALGVVMAAHNYPETPRKGDVITGLPKLAATTAVTSGTEASKASVGADDKASESKVFHAGTVREGDATVTSGGRVLCVTAIGDSVKVAQRNAYDALERIHFDGMQFRRDIGHRAMEHKAAAKRGE